MPILRLRKHQAAFSEEDILINPNDYSGLKLNDVVELKPPKGGNLQNRILLQVRNWPENNNYPNCVSIKDSVVNTHLKLYGDILVTIVDKKDVLVDSIEICFSNAYLARSYMWGLRNYLNNRCVYQRQKLDYLNIRSQICEIWAQGNKVTSGYVDDDTKIVFRSASSLVYLFIQMSSEMWDYDINGDLYCEKAINGFLTDLFDTWKRNDCSHDITIVLFSRTFYDAESIEEFPKEMRECLQVDYKNRFYEDCYRVAFQNDRFDLHDWNAKLTILKSLFNQYQKEVIDRHQEKYDVKIPRAYNSSAAQGNFLEVLNMSLNVFEKHYFDRSFDRTGQLSVVVSPGVGVFEVDFEMTNLTKQRIIDNGIGSDLVCLGEQPLHTVPLLKFNSKSNQQNDNLATCDVYNMPHWINLSFYSSQNQVYYSNFIPRIKLPTIHSKLTSDFSKANSSSEQQQAQNQQHLNNETTSNTLTLQASTANDNNVNHKDRNTSTSSRHSNVPHFSNHQTMPDLVDYDDYDAQVFKPNSMITYHYNQQPSSRGERSVLTHLDSNVVDCLDIDNDDDFLDRDNRNKAANSQRRSSDVKNYQEYSRNMKRNHQQMSENLPINQCSRVSPQIQTTFTRMSLVDSYLTDVKIKPESADDLSVRGYNVQSSRINRSNTRPKALINPFDPSHMTIKLTPNRRRWTHVFPQGPTGTFMQQHHYQPIPTVGKNSITSTYLADVSPPPIPENEPLKFSNTITTKSFNAASKTTNKQLSNVSSATNQSYHSRAKLWNDNVSLLSPTLSATINNTFNSPVTNGGYNKSALVSNDTIRFAWCASGEQEWTPAITTGVDWKSLTMPACLPLTTDFFPSKTSLQNDYVIGEYTIDSSCIHSRYTLIEVYRELVCQRLQKGFQIILLPRQSSSNHSANDTTTSHKLTSTIQSSTMPPSTNTTSKHHHQHHLKSNSRHYHSHHHQHHQHHHQQQQQQQQTNHHQHNHHHQSSSSSSTKSFSLFSSSSDTNDGNNRERAEYTMSIGRIFHKLTLNSNTITVTQYRPRHPYPTIKIDYCYRFRAPFHETYGQSWVHFKSEKLENYSWNYLDNYICARGESFELRSSLKFWRFRILILPSRTNLRKISSHETPNGSRHDVHYLDYSDEERAALMESFVRLLEIINKTRRASACRMSSSSISSINSASSLSIGPLHTSTNQTTSTSSTTTSTTNQITTATTQQTTTTTTTTNNPSSKQTTGQLPNSNLSPSRLNVQINNNREIKGEQQVSNSDNKNQNKSELQFESINMDIDSALRDAKRAEWVHVQYHCFYDVYQAFELVIKWMVASGAGIAEMVQGWSRKVGSSSVHVVPIPWEPFALPHSGKADPLRCPIGIELHIDCLVSDNQSLDDNQIIFLQERILRRFGFLTFYDLISSENIEKQFVHMSGFAFVALPNIVNDSEEESLLQHDNMTNNSSELNSPAILNNDNQQPILLAATPTNDDVPKVQQATNSNSKSGVLQQKTTRSEAPIASNYVDGTTTTTILDNKVMSVVQTPSLKLEQLDTVSSPHEKYITRHISGARKNKASRLRGVNQQIEFIWSWNYMLTKRWRSVSTQDESYAVSLMLDFKDFCQNSDNRLVEFWNEIRAKIE